ncbi:hypothetical protein [Brevibacillus fulvus]|uniref:Actin-like protein N-terminal domain-containing protein n=1 Tax=Brevibacillus fulvus TaxID=1125967 RepID=A0A939BTV8_9BACL|nr:hypothetical protein [Brevibacillus fulvus]MBM7592232.1 hypothetical protein [Brevibacillus fulvus]
MFNNDWFVVALDTGNGELKIVSDSVKRLRVGGVLGRYKAPLGKTKMQSERDIPLYEVEGDPQQWVIGYQDVDRVKAAPLLVAGREGLVRYSQPMYSTYSKIGLAKAIGDQRPARVLVVTSTPARDSLDKKIVEALDKIFRDVHKLKINDERVIINVTNYETMSETEASLYDVYLNDEGFVADASVENQDIIVINAGYGTTDISRYNELEYIPLDRETIKVSYLDVIQRLKDWLTEQIGKEITVQEVTRQLDEQIASETKKFVFVGEEIPGFDDIYKKTVKAVFDDLFAELQILIPDPDLFNRVRVVGGAAVDSIWGQYFKKWSKRVEIPEDPQFSSARGMYRYGKYLANELREQTAAGKE